MAYVKPGVEITQVQRTFSPTLIAPDLIPVLVAPAYKVVPLDGADAYSYPKYSAGMTVTISGLTSSMKLDATSLHVDLVMTSGTNYGARLHIEPTQVTGASDGGTTFVIPSGVASAASWSGATVYVGYRALNYSEGLQGFMTFESSEDIDNKFGGGQVVPENPLPLAIYLAMSNTASSVNAVAMRYDEYATLGSGASSASTESTRCLDILAANEVYAIAPMTIDSTAMAAYRSHADNLSTAIEKRERIVFLSPKITWYDQNSQSVSDPSTADKAVTSRAVRDYSAAVGLKRTFHVFPDVAYMQDNQRQIQKIKPSYINNLYGFTATETAVLAKTYTLDSGKVYKAGTAVTDLVYTDLFNNASIYKYDVYVPVPGFMLPASIVGQIAGQNPEQGHTNLPIAGPSKLKYSNEFFSESNLNTIATGGNYIMTSVGGIISSRHQLSTDMTSIERRELNITKSVDFTAKYIRNTVSGYIGRSLITPAFLQLLGTIISGLGNTLVKEGRLNGFKVTGIKQDEVQRDVVRVSIEIQPKYPVNYIKVDLIF